MARHCRVESSLIHGNAPQAQRILRQIERKAISIVELESGFASQGIALPQPRGFFFQNLKAPAQCLEETLFLETNGLGNHCFALGEVGIGLPHLAHQGRDELVDRGIVGAQQRGVSHGAAHDAPQHITAALIGRQNTIGNQEGHGAQMVRDHPIGCHGFRRRRTPDSRGGRIDDMAEHVRLKDAFDPLQDRGHTLQPHPRIDRWIGQRLLRAVGELLVLHENQIPELEEPVAVFFRRARRAAPDMLTAIDEDFRARTARAGIAHGPEIIRGRNADDLVVGEPGDLFPILGCLVVRVIDGHKQLVLGQAEFFGDQVPGQLDRLFLEIIAEREIAQHFKEGEVPRREPHIVEVVVLAAGAHAFLRGGRAAIGAFFKSGEHVLELHHARIGEHQRRIVAWHQWARGDLLVTILGKEVEKGRTDVVYACHDRARNPVCGRTRHTDIIVLNVPDRGI